jgi:hypothetical protein
VRRRARPTAGSTGSCPGSNDTIGQRAEHARPAEEDADPVADLISVPIQSNFSFGYGATEAPKSSSTQIITNVQPVVPITLGNTGFNLIARPIIPIVRQPDLLEGGDTVGLGDIQVQTFLSPADADELVWGVGGVLQSPTATDGKDLATQKWSAGPAAVVLAMPGKWV